MIDIADFALGQSRMLYLINLEEAVAYHFLPREGK
jgi:hypothetical protein